MNKYQLYALSGALLAGGLYLVPAKASGHVKPRPPESKAADIRAERAAEDKRERKRQKRRRLGGRG